MLRIACLIPILLAPSAAGAACLSIENSGNVHFWINHCGHRVSVNWTDQGNCSGWSCSTIVSQNARQTSAFKGHVEWCECNYDEACSARGPC